MIAELLYLGRQDLIRLGITMADVIAVVEAAIRQQSQGKVRMPAKATLAWKAGGRLNGNCAFIESPAALGIKWNAEVPANVEDGLPNLTALIVLNDPKTGFPIAVLDGTWITAMRTGAVSAVTARYFAPELVTTLGLIGCGVQMRTQLLALATVLRPATVRVYDERPAATEAFVAQMSRRVEIEIQSCRGAREAIEGADVVVSATRFVTPPQPTLKGEWLARGALALPIDVASAWEPSAYLEADKFVTDRWDVLKTVAESGHFPQGLPRLHAELHEVVEGKVPGRESDGERIVVMNEGMPIEDMATGRLAYDRALAAGVGTRLPFIGSPAELVEF
jgi:ornithine cyclodeaminase/alanine dehydrogenase-like protein (mu-crystallin family)